MIFTTSIFTFVPPTRWLSVSRVANLVGRITRSVSQCTLLKPIFSNLSCSCHSDRMRIADCESLRFDLGQGLEEES